MKEIIWVYLLIINVTAFWMYAIDKRKAVKNKWRISERALLLAAFLGGSVGAFAGMKVFHHKTNHWKFKILVPLFLILQIVLAVVLKIYVFQ